METAQRRKVQNPMGEGQEEERPGNGSTEQRTAVAPAVQWFKGYEGKDDDHLRGLQEK